MTPDAEVAATSKAFQTALVAMGARTRIDVLEMWSELEPGTPRPPRTWMGKLLRYLGFGRYKARRAASAYYRLTRALMTGVTVPPVHDELTPEASLDDLRADFQDSIREYVPQQVLNELPTPAAERGDPLPQDEIPDLEQRLEQVDELASRDDERILSSLSDVERLAKVDPDEPEAQAAKKRGQAHENAGAQVARSAEWAVLDGARNTVWTSMSSDDRALGWARISTTGTPCYFCAMLLSRGAVYKTARDAQFSEGDLFHPDCKCIAIPVYSMDFFEQSPLFEDSRRLKAEWKDNASRDLNPALSWRRYYEKQYPESVHKRVRPRRLD